MPAYTDTGTTSTEVAMGGTPPSAGIRAFAGFAVRETASATAVVEYHDGTSTAGRRLLSVNLAANESGGESFANWKVVTTGHVFVNIVSGTVRWYADVVA